MRSPASASTQDRAGFIRSNNRECIRSPEAGKDEFSDLAALVIARRYGLSPGMARLVASLASLGGRFA